MSDPDDSRAAHDPDEPHTRPPRGPAEFVLANCRPQPAIPALLVLIGTIAWSVIGLADTDGQSLFAWLTPIGIVVSCGLAIAAGCCSLFPQFAWILIAVWALKFTATGALPAYNRYVLVAGIAAAGAMVFIQLWRVRTGRFLPTVRVNAEADR